MQFRRVKYTRAPMMGKIKVTSCSPNPAALPNLAFSHYSRVGWNSLTGVGVNADWLGNKTEILQAHFSVLTQNAAIGEGEQASRTRSESSPCLTHLNTEVKELFSCQFWFFSCPPGPLELPFLHSPDGSSVYEPPESIALFHLLFCIKNVIVLLDIILLC